MRQLSSTSAVTPSARKSAKAFEELNKIGSDIKVKVLRNGKTEIIAQGDIVVGDIVILETGNKIPADGRLLESVSLQVDESSLTGESANVEKDENLLCDEKTPVAERKNMLYSGCFVTSGNGKMVVTIEAENNSDIEKLEEVFHNCDYIIDFTHHAFYFGDEVEKAELTGVIPDFDIKKPFSKKRIL